MYSSQSRSPSFSDLDTIDDANPNLDFPLNSSRLSNIMDKLVEFMETSQNNTGGKKPVTRNGAKSTRKTSVAKNKNTSCSKSEDSTKALFLTMTELMEEVKSIHKIIKQVKDESALLRRTLEDIKSDNIALKDKVRSQDEKIESLTNLNQKLDEKCTNFERQQNKGKFIVRGESIAQSFQTSGIDSVVPTFAKKINLPQSRFANVSVRHLANGSDKFLMVIPDNKLITDIFHNLKANKIRNLFFSDFLSSTDNHIAFQLRKFKRDKKIFSISYYRGMVYCKISENSQKIPVRSIKELETLSRKLQR